MLTAPLPPDETARVAALRSLAILDTPAEAEYDDFARLASQICGTPISLVSLVDSGRQWFKAKVGITACETPCTLAFCAHALLQSEVMIVPDATLDERFQDHPLVTGDPQIRFYAGMPLTTPEGQNVGTLCVLDHRPRSLTDDQSDALRVLGRQVMAHMVLRRQVEQLQQRTAEREAALAAAQVHELKFKAVVTSLAEGIMLIDAATRRFVDVNEALLDLLGYTKAELMALEPFDIVAKESHEMFTRTVADMDGQLAQEGRCDLGRRHLRRKDGTGITAEIHVTVVPDEGAGLHVVIVRDITDQLQYEERLFEYQLDLEQANAKLRALATTDGLLGIYNRAAFNEKLLEAFERAQRYARALSVILMDVDHFKKFNDTFGHPAGDDVLKSVAKILCDTVRSADIVARYGGEEFAIILPDTEYAGAMVLAERCRRAIAAHPWNHRAITASIGVSTLSPTTGNPSVLVQEADDALYRAKQSGRNRVSHHNINLVPVGAS